VGSPAKVAALKKIPRASITISDGRPGYYCLSSQKIYPYIFICLSTSLERWLNPEKAPWYQQQLQLLEGKYIFQVNSNL